MFFFRFDYYKIYIYIGIFFDNKDFFFINFNEIIIVLMFKKIIID